MMGLRDIGASLPPGFRFFPSDEELVCHYLYNKILTSNNQQQESLKGTATTLVEIDLHTCEPWQLPEVAKLNANEWYFFSFRDRKYATGFRTNRATVSGYWKATGKDRTVIDPETKELVGMRKTLVFYRNRAPNGVKTGWIMHEFRLETPQMPPKEDWVLCRVFHKSKTDESSKLEREYHHQQQQQLMMFQEHQQQQQTSSATTVVPCRILAHADQQQPASCAFHRQLSSFSATSPPLNPQNQTTTTTTSSTCSFLNLLHQRDHSDQLTHTNINSATEITSKAAAQPDHFGSLFWDMNMEDHSCLCDSGDIPFEIDDNMDVFLS